MNTITPTCCKREFIWPNPKPNTYGNDMPKFCPWCGAEFNSEYPTMIVGVTK